MTLLPAGDKLSLIMVPRLSDRGLGREQRGLDRKGHQAVCRSLLATPLMPTAAGLRAHAGSQSHRALLRLRLISLGKHGLEHWKSAGEAPCSL